MNDTSKLDKACGPLKDLMKCAEPCPDSDIKKMALGAYKFTKFMCVDRIDDLKKNLPCMSDSCPDIQRQCVPKCGSIEASTDRVGGLLRNVQGVPDDSTSPPGHGGHGSTMPPNSGRTPGKDVDMSTIKKMVADTCTTIGCFMTCSEAPTTKACGKDAYILGRDIIWTMFSALAQSMSSLGIQDQWPAECQSVGLPVVVATVVPIRGTGTPAAGSTIPPGTTVPPATRAGTGTPAGTAPPAGTGTPAGTAPPAAGTTVANGSVKAVSVAPIKECKNPPCGSSSTTIISSFLILASISILFFRKI